MTVAAPARSVSRATTLGALTLLYAAQGVPFGLAAEYLPVVLRQAGYTRVQIAAMFWLQLPWQLKPLWAWLGDHPAIVPRSRVVLLALQVCLSLSLAWYAAFDPASGLTPWFLLTALAALLAATQDVFVDAFAVRTLSGADRGLGNSAQIAGYRVGIILGGGGLLVLAGRLGLATPLLAAAGFVLVTSVAAFVLRPHIVPSTELPPAEATGRGAVWALAKVALSRRALAVVALALTYKLGIHAAATLVKPMLVDAGWTPARIGGVVVTVGTGAAIAGSVLGGLAHRHLGEARALAVGAVLQAATLVPLAIAERAGLPYLPTAVAIAAEHAASGLATTVLFAALMSATHPAHAALHYTILTTLNAVTIGVGGLLGARLGDSFGVQPALAVSGILCALPLACLPGWAARAAASSGRSAT